MTQTLPSTAGAQEFLDQLQATRNAEWNEDQLKAHAAVRQGLEDAADRDRFVKSGDRVAPFALAEVDGGSVVLADLLATGPVVLLFFRFEGCPACNAALQGYQQTLAQPLRDLGAHLVAISAQVPERLGAIKHRHKLDFLVASDPEASLFDAFGIGFEPDEAGREASRQKGADLGDILGTGRWTLPYPTAVVIGQDGVVRFAEVHPNWMVRTEAAPIIAAVEALVGPAGDAHTS
jgi:peroxiredoxin